MERFLYRLGQSTYRERFFLKGALMLRIWAVPLTRPTMDIDLLGRKTVTREELETMMRECLALTVPDDGIQFDPHSIRADVIKKDAEYEGWGFRFEGPILCKAIQATFKRRKTGLPSQTPVALSSEFSEDKTKKIQWRAFVQKSKLAVGKIGLKQVVSSLRDFLMPPTEALVEGKTFRKLWPPSGPWRAGRRRIKKKGS